MHSTQAVGSDVTLSGFNRSLLGDRWCHVIGRNALLDADVAVCCEDDGSVMPGLASQVAWRILAR